VSFYSKASHKDTTAWLIAVDIRNKMLPGVAQLDYSCFIRYQCATDISNIILLSKGVTKKSHKKANMASVFEGLDAVVFHGPQTTGVITV
jgi:hypothetical protein